MNTRPYRARIRNKMPLIFLVVMCTLLFGISAQALSLEKNIVKLRAGNAFVLRLEGNSEGESVVWKSSRKSVVAVTSSSHNRAVLKARKAGTARITATIGSIVLRCKVTVLQKQKMPKTVVLRQGDTFKFQVSRKAIWTVSNKKGKLGGSGKRKQAVLKASKTGNCTLVVVTKNKTYTCKVKIIRRDGATKADLAEEKAIRERQNPDDNGNGDGNGDDNSGDTDAPNMTTSQITILTKIAMYACREAYDGEEILADRTVHAMDLTGASQAYLLYIYEYHADDHRISRDMSGEYNVAGDATMKTILKELFGGAVDTNAYSLFCKNYVNHIKNNVLYMYSTGDFGSPEISYFATPDKLEKEGDNGVVLSGRIMTSVDDLQSYIHTANYRAHFFRNSNGTYMFSYVETM